VRPSRLRTYLYCPRLYFFEAHLGREPGDLCAPRLLAYLSSTALTSLAT
jgi:hypothetical protein